METKNETSQMHGSKDRYVKKMLLATTARGNVQAPQILVSELLVQPVFFLFFFFAVLV